MRLKQSAPARLRWLEEAERQADLWAHERERRPSGTTLWPRCPAVTQVGSFMVAVLHFAVKRCAAQSMHRAALAMLESMASEAVLGEAALQEAVRADPTRRRRVEGGEAAAAFGWFSEEVLLARETVRHSLPGVGRGGW